MNTFQKVQPLNIKLYFIVFSILLALSYVATDRFLFGNPVTTAAISNAEKKSIERQGVVNEFVKHSSLMLESLANSAEFKTYLDNPDDKTNIKGIFKILAGGTDDLMQIRFLDKNGMEDIRIDRSADGKTVTLIPDHLLQDKSQRYYFKHSKETELNKVWFSALDLNIEQGKIEQPFKPTLRGMMPIEHNGSFVGVLIINYYMEGFIKKLLHMPLYSSTLINNTGEILVHYNPKNNWSSHTGNAFTLKDEFPLLYPQIIESDTYGNGSFFYRKFDIPLENGLGLILKLNPNFVEKQNSSSNNQAVVTFLLILFFSALLSQFLTRVFQKYLNKLNSLLDTLSETSKVAKVGFWEYAKDSETLSCSDGTYEIFEISDVSTPITYQKFISYLPEDEQAQMLSAYRESVDSKKPYYFVHGIKTAKGNIKYLEERAQHEYDQDGKLVRSLGSVYDITEKVLKDKTLNTQKNELEAIFDTALEAIGLLDKNAQYLKVNQKYTEILEYSENELLHSSCLELTHPDNYEEAKKVLEITLKEGSYENYERPCITKSGTIKILNSSYSLMPDGKTFLVTTEDFTELRNAEKEIIENSYIDDLTQIKNRKAFNEKSKELFSLFQRYQKTFSFIILDIDDFKAINDQFGHQHGDEILIAMGDTLKKTVRSTDSVFRIGGEEFVILTPETHQEAAALIAEKVRKTINQTIFTKTGNVSISAGVSEVLTTDQSIEAVYLRADQKLYQAKAEGKNRVCH